MTALHIPSDLLTSNCNLTNADSFSNPAASASTIASSMAYSISSETSKITSATAPKTATETATTANSSKATNAAVAINAGDASVMAAALGFVAWML